MKKILNLITLITLTASVGLNVTACKHPSNNLINIDHCKMKPITTYYKNDKTYGELNHNSAIFEQIKATITTEAKMNNITNDDFIVKNNQKQDEQIKLNTIVIFTVTGNKKLTGKFNFNDQIVNRSESIDDIKIPDFKTAANPYATYKDLNTDTKLKEQVAKVISKNLNMQIPSEEFSLKNSEGLKKQKSNTPVHFTLIANQDSTFIRGSLTFDDTLSESSDDTLLNFWKDVLQAGIPASNLTTNTTWKDVVTFLKQWIQATIPQCDLFMVNKSQENNYLKTGKNNNFMTIILNSTELTINVCLNDVSPGYSEWIAKFFAKICQDIKDIFENCNKWDIFHYMALAATYFEIIHQSNVSNPKLTTNNTDADALLWLQNHLWGDNSAINLLYKMFSGVTIALTDEKDANKKLTNGNNYITLTISIKSYELPVNFNFSI